MFKETDPQGDLFALSNQLPENVRKRLEESWAHGFATRVMPILLEVEDKFAGIYDDNTGRPAWSVARKLGICLLQQWFDCDDQEAVDELSYDVRWQYALGVGPKQAYLSRRSLVQFRSDLVEFDPQMKLVKEVFEQITDEALEELDIEVEQQRADSTQIVSNIQTRGRVWLFGETLMKFLRQLRDEKPDAFNQLPEPLKEWLTRRLDGKGWFGRGARKHAPIEQLAKWLVGVMRRYETVEEIGEWESYQLVARLVDEHCHLEKDAEKDDAEDGTENGGEAGEIEEQFELRDKPENGGASMQTPHDPDAGFGKKGCGYSVHIVETCYNEKADCELLTGYKVDPANENDWGETPELYNALEEAGWAPDRMFADAGYPTAESLVDAQKRDSTLHAPASKKRLPDEYVGRQAFEFDENGRVVSCPNDKTPLKHTRRKQKNHDEPVLHAVFEAGDCEGCPFEGKCPARHSHGDKWYVSLSDRLRARDEALASQKEEGWWEAYRIRSGIEATVSEMKRTHGLGQLRVRGKERVDLAVGLKMTACNIKRWLAAVDPQDPTGKSPFLSAYRPISRLSDPVGGFPTVFDESAARQPQQNRSPMAGFRSVAYGTNIAAGY